MTDPIIRLNAALEGRYRVERELGQGGMATVYLADDLKHERQVALKVLKPELAAVVGGERFLAEIKTTANLQHPHILPLFDSGEADGFLFYVMPVVEGESLRERLDGERQLPVEDAVRISSALAEALDYAHRHGVIHRDIKPANVLIHDGQPVITDFGVALAVGAAGGGRLTETGLSVGTPHYMSPEQASGDEAVGPTSDIYALGCVAYEMLVGEPPYTGSSAQAVIAKIITKEPESVREHRKSVPANVEAAVAKALERLPADRFTTAGAFARALRDPAFTDAARAPSSAAPAGPWKVVTGAAVTLAAVLALTTGWALSRSAPVDVSRYSILLPDEQSLDRGLLRPRIATTPDGSRLVYVSRGADGVSRLLVRRRDELVATALRGTEQAQSPFMSPDGQQVGFMRSGAELWIAPLGGGAQVLVDGDEGIGLDGATWGADDFLYYDGLTGDGTIGVMRVPVTGGEREQVTTVDRPGGEVDHVWPEALPDGRGVLFTVLASEGGLQRAAVGVTDGESGDHRVLVLGIGGRYAASGHLLYVTADGRLMAQRFDLDRLELRGEAVEIARGLSIRVNASVDLTLSPTGILYYAVGEQAAEPRDLVWIDRQGDILPIDAGWAGDFRSLALSPDGSRAVVAESERSVNTLQQLYVKELDGGGVLRLTFEGGLNREPAWTPDGGSVLFVTDRAGTPDLFVRRADGGAPAQPLVQSDNALSAGFYSPDGEWLLYVEEGTLYAERTGDRGERLTVLQPGFERASPRLSPDGRFLAYESAESGRPEIYVIPFPTGDWRRQVSSGGIAPLWSRSGQELIYLTDADEVVSVEVLPGDAFQSGERSVLFSLPIDVLWENGIIDVSSDDSRFLLTRNRGTATGNELIVVEGFLEELQRVLPN